MNVIESLICEYKGNTVCFVEHTEKYDKEYVFVKSGIDDFSLYNIKDFENLQENLFRKIQSTQSAVLKKITRAIFSHAITVNIENGCFELPECFDFSGKLKIFEAVVYPTHIRFIPVEKKKACENDSDIVGMTFEKFFDNNQ